MRPRAPELSCAKDIPGEEARGARRKCFPQLLQTPLSPVPPPGGIRHPHTQGPPARSVVPGLSLVLGSLMDQLPCV